MIRVRERECERVAEHGRGLFEGYAVLAQVGGRFWRVPIEFEHEPADYPINPSTGDDAEA